MIKKAGKSATFSGNWRSLDWVGLNKECLSAQKTAVDTEQSALTDAHSRFLERKEAELVMLAPESGAYEGNLSEEYPYPKLDPSVTFRIKRKASSIAVEEFIERYHLADFSIQVLSELLKHISDSKLSSVSGEDYDPKAVKIEYDIHGKVVPMDGMVSPAALYKSTFSDDTMMGVYNFLMLDSRSKYLEKQYQGTARSYCALVPLIMYAFKYYKNVPYSHWYPTHIQGVVNPKLCEAMQFRLETPLSKEEVLAAREEGLTIKSGRDAGGKRNPTYTHKLYGASGFKGIPEQAQVMLGQIWCAHPVNRTKYMVLDFNRWDTVPEPLIGEALLPEYTPKATVNDNNSNMPWL